MPDRRVALTAVAVALSACSAPAAPDASSTESAAAATVLVTSGVRYAGAPDGWRDPTLDLYLPGDAGEPPVAVVVPDPAADPAVSEALGRAVAARGVVAAVVQWGVADPALAALAGRAVDDVVAQVEQVNAEVGCAVAAAASEAGAGVGGPGRPLLVVGHGAGANAAAMAALLPVEPFPGCFVAGAPPPVAAVLLWDGDWLGTVADDVLGAGAAPFLAAYSPWPSADVMSPRPYVEVGVNANRLAGLAVGAAPGSEYLASRDPSGGLAADPREVDAFADGAVDPVDVTRAFAAALGDAEVASREREVHGEGDPDTLGPRVRALLVESVVQLSGS